MHCWLPDMVSKMRGWQRIVNHILEKGQVCKWQLRKHLGIVGICELIAPSGDQHNTKTLQYCDPESKM